MVLNHKYNSYRAKPAGSRYRTAENCQCGVEGGELFDSSFLRTLFAFGCAGTTNMPDAQIISRSRRRQSTLAKQACDACKLRKVKCIYDDSIAPPDPHHRPCQRCSRMTIACTFSLPQKCRGPRRPRADARYVLWGIFEIFQDFLTRNAIVMTPAIRPLARRQHHKMSRLF